MRSKVGYPRHYHHSGTHVGGTRRVLSARANNPPSASDLARCVAIAAPDARLSCYDTLAGRSHELEGTATPSVKSIGATTSAPAAAPPTDGQNSV